MNCTTASILSLLICLCRVNIMSAAPWAVYNVSVFIFVNFTKNIQTHQNIHNMFTKIFTKYSKY